MGREKEGGNKTGYMANLFVWGWAGGVLKKVTRASGQEPYAQKAKKCLIVAKASDGQQYPLPLS